MISQQIYYCNASSADTIRSGLTSTPSYRAAGAYLRFGEVVHALSQRIVAVTSPCKGLRLIFLGCGDAQREAQLARSIYSMSGEPRAPSIILVDSSAPLLQIAVRRFSDFPVEVRPANIESAQVLRALGADRPDDVSSVWVSLGNTAASMEMEAAEWIRHIALAMCPGDCLLIEVRGAAGTVPREEVISLQSGFYHAVVASYFESNGFQLRNFEQRQIFEEKGYSLEFSGDLFVDGRAVSEHCRLLRIGALTPSYVLRAFSHAGFSTSETMEHDYSDKSGAGAVGVPLIYAIASK